MPPMTDTPPAMTEDQHLEHARALLKEKHLPCADLDLARFYHQMWLSQLIENGKLLNKINLLMRGGYFRGRTKETQSPVAGSVRKRDLD